MTRPEAKASDPTESSLYVQSVEKAMRVLTAFDGSKRRRPFPCGDGWIEGGDLSRLPESSQVREFKQLLDFMSDRLSNGKKIRSLDVVDAFTREALAEPTCNLPLEHALARDSC